MGEVSDVELSTLPTSLRVSDVACLSSAHDRIAARRRYRFCLILRNELAQNGLQNGEGAGLIRRHDLVEARPCELVKSRRMRVMVRAMRYAVESAHDLRRRDHELAEADVVGQVDAEQSAVPSSVEPCCQRTPGRPASFADTRRAAPDKHQHVPIRPCPCLTQIATVALRGIREHEIGAVCSELARQRLPDGTGAGRHEDHTSHQRRSRRSHGSSNASARGSRAVKVQSTLVNSAAVTRAQRGHSHRGLMSK